MAASQDLHGVLQIPNALSKEHVDDLNALLDEHIKTDTDNGWQTLRFPVSKGRPSAQTDAPESLLDWGKPHRDCRAVPGIVDMCEAIIGKRFRLDHIFGRIDTGNPEFGRFDYDRCDCPAVFQKAELF